MAGEGKRVELDLDELEVITTTALNFTEAHPDTADDLELPEWPAPLLEFVEQCDPITLTELLRRARQLEKVEAFLREHSFLTSLSLAASIHDAIDSHDTQHLAAYQGAANSFSALLRSLGIDERKA